MATLCGQIHPIKFEVQECVISSRVSLKSELTDVLAPPNSVFFKRNHVAVSGTRSLASSNSRSFARSIRAGDSDKCAPEESGKVTKISHRGESAPHSKVSVPRRNMLLGAAAGMMSIFCPICGSRGAAHAEDWSYGTLSGPSQWGELCATGTVQSPIDIPLGSAVLQPNALGDIAFSYAPASPSFLNTGHGTMQVNYPEGSNFSYVGDKKLELLQYHFHAPSEHSFNGVRTAMEAHLVHRDQSGKLAVIGVMMEGVPSAPRNLCLQAALDFSPEKKFKKIPAPVECFDEETDAPPPVRKTCFMLEINPSRLLPKPSVDGIRPYVHYEGSLTTPPCSEGVDWFLLSNPIKVPNSQVVEFMNYVGDKQTLALNSRPIQPVGNRTLHIGP